jgi:hypothetical protein
VLPNAVVEIPATDALEFPIESIVHVFDSRFRERSTAHQFRYLGDLVVPLPRRIDECP